MAKKDLQMFVVEQKILNRIYAIRGQKIMLDQDLAEKELLEKEVSLNQEIK